MTDMLDEAIGAVRFANGQTGNVHFVATIMKAVARGELIRATPEALAADPAVMALVAEAEARAAREAYRKACVAVQIVISRNTPDDGGDADPCLIDQLEAVEGLIKREAAAIRKGETP